MSHLAIDLVLLPDEEVMHQSIRFNQLSNSKSIRFGSGLPSIPHISLAMGVASSDKLGPVKEKMKEIALDFKEFTLDIGEVIHTSSVFQLRLKKNNEVLELHRRCLEIIPFEVEARPDMLYNYDENQNLYSTIEDINLFSKRASGEFYDPHITLGDANLDGFVFDRSTQIDSLYLFQLGARCTCQKELFRAEF